MNQLNQSNKNLFSFLFFLHFKVVGRCLSRGDVAECDQMRHEERQVGPIDGRVRRHFNLFILHLRLLVPPDRFHHGSRPENRQ
jgi:hypothetical protein